MLSLGVRWGTQEATEMSAGVSNPQPRPYVAKDGYECGPTQNCKFT